MANEVKYILHTHAGYFALAASMRLTGYVVLALAWVETGWTGGTNPPILSLIVR